MKTKALEIDPDDVPTFLSVYHCDLHELQNISKDALDYHLRVIKHE